MAQWLRRQFGELKIKGSSPFILTMICSHCNKDLLPTMFGWRIKNKKRRTICLECTKTYSSKHYALTKDKYKRSRYESKKHQRQKRVDFIRKAKEKPCADCGKSYPYYVMDFDHLSDKKFTLGSGYNYSVDTIKSEIAKCDVVCSNCHRERTFRRTLTR